MGTATKIGIECHLQLDTKSKLFCGCPTKGKEIPNSRTCAVCLGHPGSRPALNKKAVEYGIKLALALGCTLSRELIFSRKTYFYPDMAKNFQITQFEIPLGSRGSVKLKSGKRITVQRLHLEEDPAALVHEGSMREAEYSLIDYNRSGIPLCEIVTEPEMTSPAEAREFLKELLRIVKYLAIYDENSGVLKSDLNLSIPGHPRAEIKNVSGFKEAERALNYELVRQKIAVKEKEKIAAKQKGELKKGELEKGEFILETRAWDGSRTISLRSKESEADYGYIIEPDLPKFYLTDEMVQVLRAEVPELAHVRAERYVSKHALDPADAEVMAAERELAELFERVAAEIDPKMAAKWLRRELLRVLHYNKKSLKQVKIDERHIIELLQLVDSRQLSETTAQRLFEKLVEKPFSPREYAEKEKLMQVSSEKEIKEICTKVISSNKKAVEDYKAGKEKSFHFLVGQVMKLTQGKASPDVVNRIMKAMVEK